jgi:hypothetical protein
MSPDDWAELNLSANLPQACSRLIALAFIGISSGAEAAMQMMAAVRMVNRLGLMTMVLNGGRSHCSSPLVVMLFGP